MDVRIGVTQSPRELEVELAEGSDIDSLVKSVESALENKEGMLWFTDRRGRRVGVPAAKLAYVEFDTASDARRVGFGAAIK